jgi:formylglycine-generating enzyme required for sulfatase activity
LRGGSFNYDALGARSAYRDYYFPDYRLNALHGFRVARTYP